MNEPGQIVILNGAPRSGKSSVVAVIQDTFAGPWMNLGVDAFGRDVTPPRYLPGIGLRPGGERPDLEALIPALYAALYESVAAHSRCGLNVVVDVGHHDGYSKPLHILRDAARRLDGLPVLFVGVRCPIEVVMRRRDAGEPGTEGRYEMSAPDGTIPEPVLRWQHEVHVPGVYDIEVDTSVTTPERCAAAIGERLRSDREPTAFRQLAGTAP
jgi:chloramphenicol 3-O phosphotransferase